MSSCIALEHEAEHRKREPPMIQIVIAEASGLSLDFTQDRGIDSAFGASEKYANQLMVELLQKIDKVYQKCLKGKGEHLTSTFCPCRACSDRAAASARTGNCPPS